MSRAALIIALVAAVLGTAAPALAQDDGTGTPGSSTVGVPVGTGTPSDPATPPSDPAATPDPAPSTTSGGDGSGPALLVPEIIGLAIDDPTPWAHGGSAGGGLRDLVAQLVVRVATTNKAILTVTDADETTARRGFVAAAGGYLARPLRVRLADAGSAFLRALTAPVQSPLETWEQPVSFAPTTVELHQAVTPRQDPRDLKQKDLLVTVSPPTP